jgi:MFS family permease
MIGLVSALRIIGGGLHNYGFTVFFLPVTQELGLSRASTSLAFSLARAQGSFLSPLVGYLVDRYGPKPMMITASLLAGVGYIVFSWVDSYTTFLIVYLGVISISFTAGFVHAPTIVANTWFIRLRARAMTVVSAAVPVGGAIITPVLALVVSWWGVALGRLYVRHAISCGRPASMCQCAAVSRKVWKGLSQTQASVLLAGFAIFNLPLHFVLGWIGDYVNKPKLTAICMLLGVVAILPMLWSDSPWALWFFTALYCVLDASIPVYWRPLETSSDVNHSAQSAAR